MLSKLLYLLLGLIAIMVFTSPIPGQFWPEEKIVSLEIPTSIVPSPSVAPVQDFVVSSIEPPLPAKIILDVPFSAQAPFGNWKLPYQEACEEASVIMVKYFLEKASLSALQADKEIINMVEWATKNGYEIDTNVAEILEIAQEFYGLQGEIFYDEAVNTKHIKKLLAAGHPVIIPAAGRLLGNIYFTALGPQYHMLVIIGYDESHFITHDPGTKRGAEYKYTYEVIDKAIHDWNGSKDTITEGRRAMFIVY